MYSLTKVLVVYESKHGNTKLAAEKIIEGMSEVKDIEVSLYEIKEVNLTNVPNYDVILIGSPNHFGGPTRSIKKFIDSFEKINLNGKLFAVFDTYLGKDYEKAVNKMENKVNEKVLGSRLVTPGLSIRVQGMKGPIQEEEFLKCKEFGRKIVNQLAS